MKSNYMIFPYTTPFGYYIYDGNHNEILVVYKELFDYIVKYINNEKSNVIPKESVVTDFGDLQEAGYILPSFVTDISHPYTNEIPKYLERKVDQVTLQVTQNCNLRCSYCIYSAEKNLGQRSHSEKKMSLDVAKKAIEFYKEHSVDSKVALINFYGGEPLLEYNLIKKVVNYSEELFRGKQVKFSITTNATLLSEEVIDFLVDNNFSLTFSMDGPKSIQDKNRKFINGKGSYDIVYENINRLYKKHPEYMKSVTISMVVDSDSEYTEIVKLFDQEALKDVKLSYTIAEEDGLPKTYSDQFLEEYFYDSFVGYAEYFRNQNTDKIYPSKLIEQDFSVLDKKIKRFEEGRILPVSAPSGPCLPGKTRLFVSCSGNLYPCERVNENDCMKIGNIINGFDYSQVSNILNIGKLTEEKCKKCWAFQLCNICVKRADDCGELSAIKKAAACESAKLSACVEIRNNILSYEHQEHMKKMVRFKKALTR